MRYKVYNSVLIIQSNYAYNYYKIFISYVPLCSYASCIDAYRNWIARNLPVYSATIRDVTCYNYNYMLHIQLYMYIPKNNVHIFLAVCYHQQWQQKNCRNTKNCFHWHTCNSVIRLHHPWYRDSPLVILKTHFWANPPVWGY